MCTAPSLSAVGNMAVHLSAENYTGISGKTRFLGCVFPPQLFGGLKDSITSTRSVHFVQANEASFGLWCGQNRCTEHPKTIDLG